MDLDFLQGVSGLEMVAIAMVAVAGGILLIFLLAAAKGAREEMINEEHDRRDD